MRIFSLLLLLFIAFLQAQAQKDPNTKFGKITAADLQPKAYALDSSAPAVVLFDVGVTDIISDRKGGLAMTFKHRKRIHILNKNGYEYADVSIPLYKEGMNETRLEGLKAVTYNLEGDKLAEIKLGKEGIFKEQVNKNRSRVKFTFPSVKEGSVIEYEYTLYSDFYFSLMPWTFQGKIPCLWSEYQFSLPQFMDYIFMSQGYFPFHIKEQKNRSAAYVFTDASTALATESATIRCNATDYRWVMKNVPVLKEEKFTSTLDNHVAKIEFQLAGYKDPLNPRQIMSTWPQAAKGLLERDDFGKLFLAGNNWLDDEVKIALAGAGTREQKARNIYAYVRDHYTCTDHSSLIPDQSLKAVVKNHKGTVSELNLLLVAMLRNAGIEANPLVLSTRNNGYPPTLYPLMNRLNYVACQAMVDGKPVFLDASHSSLGYGRMMYDCYNGTARVVNEYAPGVDFISDSLVERKFTFATYSNIDGKWQGRLQQTPGYYESVSLREELKSGSTEAYGRKLQKSFTDFAAISNVKVDSVKLLEHPVVVHFDLTPQHNGADLLYINPFAGEVLTENPFKSANRYYPVEMPFTIDETYTVYMEIPEGYVLDEAPKSVRMHMNEEGDGQFEYLISVSNSVISMRMRLQMKRTYFAPEEYEMIREFYNQIVSKQSEQLVFKKKK